jgi:hypothetical protein
VRFFQTFLFLLLCGTSRVLAGGFVSPGELASDHAELEGITRCVECHAPFQPGVDEGRCLSCHEEIQAQVDRERGFHARRATQCESCHPDHRGLDFELIQFDEEGFNHLSTGFPIDGEHEGLECNDCHTDESGSWQGLERECISCHVDEDPHGTENSDRDLLESCDSCHTAVDWSALPLLASIFDHGSDVQVDYPLTGAHVDVDCEDCHSDWQFVPTDHERCLDCHIDPHFTEFDAICEDCHPDPNGWHVASFDHELTGYHLEGLHELATCRGCHGSHVTTRRAHERCDDCHDTTHGDQFDPRDCDSCHTVVDEDYLIPSFDHEATDYPLTGAHSSMECAGCHSLDEEPIVYADLAHDSCEDCHDDIHEERFAPQECADCHSTVGWSVEEFDHDLTEYPLEGEHIDVECVECHGSTESYLGEGQAHETSLFSSIGSFELEFDSCLDCHSDTNPHGEAIEADSCDSCHDVTGWDVADYDHEPEFTLGDAHAEVECVDCHDPDLVAFDGLEPNCDSCHSDQEPWGHYQGGECDDCHQAADWMPAFMSRNNHQFTGFALTGSHRLLACVDCHDDGTSYGSPALSCAGCHSQDDAHRNLLGDACEDCHADTNWFRTTWRHSMVGWPLRGGHKLAACDDCHATGYAGTPTDCWRCHETEARPTNSAHQSAFVRDCDACHRPYSWSATISFGQ